ncbi:DUF192 domain-containing protein [Blastopirellula marina]|uniref:DUF192 domain-containing protein n=1 Tax=Blastopirellula marina TaxID=124 RepID=A0A2S8GHE2_9BACT|nr:DUF192 domain-containing protein [Blastopirellula marina]PQO43857.1 DUF192 domain-containing protein [Blastopirellula marina]
MGFAIGQLVDAQDGTLLLPRLYLAADFWHRFRGLQLHRPLEEDEGLLLYPCRSVHTCFLRFSLDLHFFARDGRWLGEQLNVRPFRASAGVRDAAIVIETSSRCGRRFRPDRPIQVALNSAYSRHLPAELLRQS